MTDDGDLYAETVREMLPELIGQTILDLSQHDRQEYLDGAVPRVELLLDSGSTLTFYADGVIELRRPNGDLTTLSPNGEP